MKKLNLLYLFILNLLLISCGSNSGKKKSDFSLFTETEKNEFQLGESVQLKIRNIKNRQIDSAALYFQEKYITSSKGEPSLQLQLQNFKLGNHVARAIVFSEGETDTITLPVKIYNNIPPTVYTYRIINTYPHDQTAYTQGLEFYRDTLYESTGQYGSSTLRKTNFETGEVLQQAELADKYFGEGLSILNDKIYQLTWNEGEGLIYDVTTLERQGSFKFNNSKEGWGLCNDGHQFYKSDGTEKIWILNGKTLVEETFIQPTTHRSVSTQLNELEWVEGMIYANTYQKDGVAIINPENGAIEGLINFQGLREKVTQHANLDVLNGIAYNPNTKKLYVTGKNWDKLFEVEIVER
ncbi:glutaminyl-peptide cyclotransferase [Antarcticibacterium flavum]|uniref:Glutaminyl-peptide cyclotransferase n=1 Tax=Antarcticibacterium flavum TaxID=2058175 RepID=A0A5B7X618_9FLAO|nr:MULTISPECIES: glutaminyl-peptide cyclotransferase [Antarcticibacterium]MCM4159567.1 glutamine cyclotransferase [Antarcticibacterium sp. W02-3]QCY70819.1 glutaminyl-peptide cyclotransferase [Antarcticibacterium flavum]